MKEITAYKCSDGQIFESREKAEQNERTYWDRMTYWAETELARRELTQELDKSVEEIEKHLT